MPSQHKDMRWASRTAIFRLVPIIMAITSKVGGKKRSSEAAIGSPTGLGFETHPRSYAAPCRNIISSGGLHIPRADY
jgi:hypothetical protein